jgi:hypothetical protein
MRKSYFTEERIAFALRQAEHGTKVVEVCRRLERLAADLCLDEAVYRSTHKCTLSTYSCQLSTLFSGLCLEFFRGRALPAKFSPS